MRGKLANLASWSLHPSSSHPAVAGRVASEIVNPYLQWPGFFCEVLDDMDRDVKEEMLVGNELREQFMSHKLQLESELESTRARAKAAEDRMAVMEQRMHHLEHLCAEGGKRRRVA